MARPAAPSWLFARADVVGPWQSPAGSSHSYPQPAVQQRQRADQHEKESRPEPQADRQRPEPRRYPDRAQDAGDDSPSGSQLGVLPHARSGPSSRFEQLDGIPRGILQENLIASDPLNQVAPEANTRGAQGVDHHAQVSDLQLEAVPAARLGTSSVRHRLPAPTLPAGHAEEEAQVAASQHGKGGGGTHLDREIEMPGVEGDRRVEIGDDVADADLAHGRVRFDPDAARTPRSFQFHHLSSSGRGRAVRAA